MQVWGKRYDPDQAHAMTRFAIARAGRSRHVGASPVGAMGGAAGRNRQMNGQLAIARRGADPAAVERATATLWAALVFDDDARAALRRDGLSLDGVRISGPNPYTVLVADVDADLLIVTAGATDTEQREALLALWHVYFMKRVMEPRAD